MPTTSQHHDAVRIRRHYAASPETIWRAWTDPQALSRWFGPPGAGSATSATFDLRPGGAYRIAFGTPDGQRNEVAGKYEEVMPHRRLVFTWAWHSTPDRISRIAIELAPVAGGTELTFVHDRFADAAALANHARGWPSFFDRLDDYLRSATEEK